jgi:hypothetical protein
MAQSERSAPELVPEPAAPTEPETSGGLKRYCKLYRKSNQRRRDIQNFLVSSPNRQIQQGPWDPYTLFTSKEAVQAFYSNNEYPRGKDRLIYREKFARWAIGEALRTYSEASPDSFGRVLPHNPTGNYDKLLPKTVMDKIRVTTQRDLDAEVGSCPIYVVTLYQIH